MVPQVLKGLPDLQELQGHLAYQVHLVLQDHKAAQVLLAFEDKWEILVFQGSKEKLGPRENQVPMAPKDQLDLLVKKGKEVLVVTQDQSVFLDLLEKGVLLATVAFQDLMVCQDQRVLKGSVVLQGLQALKEAKGILVARVNLASQVPGV